MFKKAEKKQAKLRLAIIGASGSGKTLGALLVSSGIGERIAMIDTERGSGELYSDRINYDIVSITPPFTHSKFIEAIREAERAKYEVLIIDSLSHAWDGEGGLLDTHDMATKANKTQNSFSSWKEVTPLYNDLINTILQSDLHIIITLRTKTAYEVTRDDNGKTKPVKIGTKPIFRDSIEYEFTTVFDLSTEGHIATSSKDRTGLFDGKHILLSKEVGTQLANWLGTGIDGDAKEKETTVLMVQRIHKAENIFELQNWWKKHQDEIKALKPDNRLLVISAKDSKKEALEKAKLQKSGARYENL